MSTINRVLVVGGGIAGLSSAIALAKRGISCDVVEKAERPAGAAITLLNRAVDALQELDVLPAFLDAGVPRSPQEMFRYFDADGQALPTPPMPERPPGSLPLGIVMYRPVMSQILQQAAHDAGVRIRTGTGLVALTQTDDSVTTTFSDGSEATYDLVVGADGVRSTTRQQIFGDSVVPEYTGVTMFRWVAQGVPDVGPVGFYQSQYLIVLSRLHDGGLYLATGRDFATKPRLDPAQAREIVRENLASFGAPIMEALSERLTDDDKITVNDYDWLMTPRPWHRGRVVLIGDAAHATSAHLASGGGMALEDAVVLGQEVEGGGSVDEILERFTERRFERTRLVVETSVEIGRLQAQGESVAQQNQLRGMAMGALASPY